jgi:hypothetical protein
MSLPKFLWLLQNKRILVFSCGLTQRPRRALGRASTASSYERRPFRRQQCRSLFPNLLMFRAENCASYPSKAHSAAASSKLWSVQSIGWNGCGKNAMEILDERSALKLIRKQMKESQTARLAVAFWGKGAVGRLGIDKRKEPVEIVCNLSQGGTNPKEVRALFALPHIGKERVLQNDKLHAKVYLFDQLAVVGSSNASANGLCLEGEELKGWLEANVVVPDGPGLVELRRMLTKRFAGRAISEPDLKAAEELRKRRRTISKSVPGKSLLDALINNPEIVERENIYFAAYDEDLSDAGEKEQKQLRFEQGPDFGLFESWPDVPREVPIVCFWIGTRGSLRPDGVWLVARKRNDRQNGRYQVCQRFQNASIFEPNQKDPRWKDIWKWVGSTKLWLNRDGGIIMPMSGIAKAISNGDVRFPVPSKPSQEIFAGRAVS